MMRGATPAVAMPTTRARGLRPFFGGVGFVGQQQGAGAIVHADALPAVTVPSGRTTP